MDRASVWARIVGVSCVLAALLVSAGCEDKKSDSGGEKKTEEKAQAEGGGGGGGGAEAAATPAGGCDRRESDRVCGEYTGSMASADWVKEQCVAYGAPYVEKCPMDDAVGRCVRLVGTPQETQEVWYAPMTKETLTAMCSGEGTELRDP